MCSEAPLVQSSDSMRKRSFCVRVLRKLSWIDCGISACSVKLLWTAAIITLVKISELCEMNIDMMNLNMYFCRVCFLIWITAKSCWTSPRQETIPKTKFNAENQHKREKKLQEGAKEMCSPLKTLFVKEKAMKIQPRKTCHNAKIKQLSRWSHLNRKKILQNIIGLNCRSGCSFAYELNAMPCHLSGGHCLWFHIDLFRSGMVALQFNGGGKRNASL